MKLSWLILASQLEAFSLNFFGAQDPQDENDFSHYFQKKVESTEKLIFDAVDSLDAIIEGEEATLSEEAINELMEEDNLVMETCNIDNPPSIVTPLYETRRDKFLIPLIAWGPNNQLRGFRESAILAVKLNRTLCIPPFFKHHSDSTSSAKGGNDMLPAEVRIDLEKIRKLLPTCETSEIQANCGARIHSIFMARDICSAHLTQRAETFRESTGVIPFMDEKCKPKDGIPIFPQPLNSKNYNNLPFNEKKLQELYDDNDATCAIWLFPYIQFQDFTLNIFSSWAGNARPSERDNNDLLENVVSHTSRPPFIRNLVDKFFTKYLDGKKYLAVHYRFDTNDWMNHCDGKDDNLTCERVVEVMHDVPKALANFADYVERQVAIAGIQAVYLAVPLSEAEVRSGMKVVLRERLGADFPMYSSEELFPYVHATGCGDYSEHDIISTSEQEVCFRSNIFLRSTPSSWSRNVYVDRLVHPEYKKYARRDDLLLNVLYQDSNNL